MYRWGWEAAEVADGAEELRRGGEAGGGWGRSGACYGRRRAAADTGPRRERGVELEGGVNGQDKTHQEKGGAMGQSETSGNNDTSGVRVGRISAGGDLSSHMRNSV